jgi:hypothetical protein
MKLEQSLSALKMANKAPRCGAKTRKPAHTPCKSPAMPNGRCRMHGGASPGAPAGNKHVRFKHGLYSKETKRRLLEVRALLSRSRHIQRSLIPD